MLAWMGYAALVAALLAAAGALFEEYSPWLVGRRRLVWLAVIVSSLLLAMIVTVTPEGASIRPSPAAQRTEHEAAKGDSPATGSSLVASSLPASGAAPSDVRTTAAGDAARTSSFATASSRLDVFLILGWLACTTLCLAALALSAWRVARMRRAWREGVIAGVPVFVSHDVGPAVIGLVHHGIVVPAWVEALREDEQRTVITHEREHVRAGDPLMLWGATLLVALAPWNIPLWYALRRLRHAIEIDCDARVLRLRPDTRAYCTLLLDVGERTLAGIAPIAALAEPATLLERRIDAMTAPVRAWDRRLALRAVAALSLIMAACWAPHPQVTPRTRIVTLVNELNGLLANDSSERSIPVAERAVAAQAIASGRSSALHPVSDPPVAWETALIPRIDDVLKRVYPQLYTRTDTAHMMIVLNYDVKGRLRAHSMRPMPSWPEFRAKDFSNVQISRFGMRELPSLHATLVLILEKWDVEMEPSPSAYGGRNAPSSSANVPPSRQYGHRVDSIARAEYPDAFEAHDDAIVVAVLFDADAKVLRTVRQRFAVADVFDAVSGSTNEPMEMRNSRYLLSRMVGTPLPKLTRSGSQTMADAPRTVFVYGVLAADAHALVVPPRR